MLSQKECYAKPCLQIVKCLHIEGTEGKERRRFKGYQHATTRSWPAFGARCGQKEKQRLKGYQHTTARLCMQPDSWLENQVGDSPTTPQHRLPYLHLACLENDAY